jgi:hypothetical protein
VLKNAPSKEHSTVTKEATTPYLPPPGCQHH